MQRSHGHAVRAAAPLDALVTLLYERGLLAGAPSMPTAGIEYREISWSEQPAHADHLHVNLHGPAKSAHWVERAFGEGAVAALWHNPRLDEVSRGRLVIPVHHERRAMSAASALLWDFPADRVRVIGVTGTNGKTTTGTALSDCLVAGGDVSGLVTTAGKRIGDEWLGRSLTTPDSAEMHRLLHQMTVAGVRTAVVEASSQGLADDRLADVSFDIGICTTIGLDHLNVHGTAQRYVEAKQRLFEGLGPDGIAVHCIDNPGTEAVVSCTPAQRVSVGAGPDAAVKLVGQTLTIPTEVGALRDRGAAELQVQSSTIGVHARRNLALAAVAAYLSGVDPGAIEGALRSFAGVPRRLQLVYDDWFTLVDDLSNPHSLEETLFEALHPIVQRRSRFVAVVAIRGSRGAEINRAQGALAGPILRSLGVDRVILTSCADVGFATDVVHDDERDAMFAEYRAAGLAPELAPELGPALASVVDDLREGDFVFLLGGRGLNSGTGLFRDLLRRSRHPVPEQLTALFGAESY